MRLILGRLRTLRCGEEKNMTIFQRLPRRCSFSNENEDVDIVGWKIYFREIYRLNFSRGMLFLWIFLNFVENCNCSVYDKILKLVKNLFYYWPL